MYQFPRVADRYKVPKTGWLKTTEIFCFIVGEPKTQHPVVSSTVFYLMSVWEMLSLPPSSCDTCRQFLVLLFFFFFLNIHILFFFNFILFLNFT